MVSVVLPSKVPGTLQYIITHPQKECWALTLAMQYELRLRTSTIPPLGSLGKDCSIRSVGVGYGVRTLTSVFSF